MTITFLQAGNGDCIHIEEDGRHVIIDSGEKCQELVSLVDSIRTANQKIDLLVISHYDSDHIKEIIRILKGLEVEERKRLVNKVWFNATKLGYKGKEQFLSAHDATEFAELLLEANINWISELRTGIVESISENLSLEVIDGGEIYKSETEDQFMGTEKVDWRTPLYELEQYLDDDAIDNSETNAQSVILIAHFKESSILLPGDAIPEKLSNALEEYRKGNVAHFELVKLPHHGSYMNITKEILGKIECSDYVISTDGSIHFHPDKKMILKLIKWGKREEGKKLTFHMNYYDVLSKQMNISELEKRQYDFDYDDRRTFEF